MFARIRWFVLSFFYVGIIVFITHMSAIISFLEMAYVNFVLDRLL